MADAFPKGGNLDQIQQRVGGSDLRLFGWKAKLMQSPPYRLLSSPRSGRSRGTLLLFLVPALWGLVLHVWPLFEMGRISLLEAYPVRLGEESDYTLYNYQLFFRDSIYFAPLLRSVVFSVLVTISTLTLVFPVAYFIACVIPKHRQIRFLLLLMTPFWAGEVVRAFVIILLLSNRGGVNQVLMWLGVIDEPISMMYTPFSLAMGVTYLSALYMLLPLYSALEKIPASLFEAASDLGAGPLGRLWKITIPMARDGIVAGCILVFLLAMGSFVVPVLVGGPNIELFAETVAKYFYEAGNRWPIGAAFSFILLATSIVSVGTFFFVMSKFRPAGMS